MKRSANIETIIDILKLGKKNQMLRYQICLSVGLPYGIGGPLLTSLIKGDLMLENENKTLSTSEKGSDYVRELGKLNEEFGVDAMIKTLSEIKEKYYKKKNQQLVKF